MTLVLIAIMVAFAAFKFVDLFKRLNPTVAKTTLLRSPQQDTNPYRPQDQGFDLSFGLVAPLDPTIGYFTVR